MTTRSLMFPGLTKRALSVEKRGDGENATPCIQGYGAVFYNEGDPGSEFWLWSDVVERIMPGAFDNALKRDDVRSFFNHDANHIVARRVPDRDDNTLGLAVDATGLQYVASVDPDDPISMHVVRAVERGDVDGSSFMFVPDETDWHEETVEVNGHDITYAVREIHDLTMYEVGAVVFPAYAGTSATAVRSRIEQDAGLARYRSWLDSHISEARADFDRWRTNSPQARAERRDAMNRLAPT